MSEYVSLPILLVALAAAFAAFILLAFRWARFHPQTKPCPNLACGAKHVPFQVIPGEIFDTEILESHTVGFDSVVDAAHPNYCTEGGNVVEVLKPRYCTMGCKLEPDKFGPNPPYTAGFHFWPNGTLNIRADGCLGSYKPTSIEPPGKQAKSA